MGERTSKIEGFVDFACPKCLESKIKRSLHERSIGAKYECKKCGFTGPN